VLLSQNKFTWIGRALGMALLAAPTVCYSTIYVLGSNGPGSENPSIDSTFA
jgi:hypothetical protein